MENFYAPDIIKTPEGGYKIIDLHGTSGGGISLVQYTYGDIERVKEYVTILHDLADGGKIVYSKNHSYHTLSAFPPNNDFTRRFESFQPMSYWVKDQVEWANRQRVSRETRPELASQDRLAHHFVYRAVRDLNNEGADIDILFCDDLKRKDDSTYIATDASATPNRRKADIDIDASEIGVYFHAGGSPDFAFLDAPFKVVNDPRVESIFNNKMLLRYFLDKTGYGELFPEYIYVGMGTSSKKAITEFASRHSHGTPSFVLKPILGARGVGVEFLGMEDVTRLFNLDSPQECYDTKELESALYEDETVVRLKDTLKGNFSLNDIAAGYAVWLNNDTMSYIRQLPADSKVPGGAMNKRLMMLKLHNFKLIDQYIAILEQFVDPEIVHLKDNAYKGHIRQLYLGDHPVVSLYRFPVTPYVGDFVDPIDVRGVFKPVDDGTESELSEKLPKMFNRLEEKVLDEIRSTRDVKRIRAAILKERIRQAREEI
jgi:hypothetical protein